MPRPDAAQKLADVAPRSGPSRAVIAAVVVVVAVLAVLGALFAGRLGQNDAAPAGTTAGVPVGASGLGQPLVLNPGAPATAPVLDLYEDPQCPVCKEFEALFGAQIDALVKANEAKVVVHTMTFLDANLRNDSSTRAANAAYCAADQGIFREYTEAVFAGQPEQEGKGWTDAELKAFASAAGVPDVARWQTCQSALTYKAHAAAVNDNALKGGVRGTPTVQLNGTTLALDTLDPSTFRATVLAAKK
jgi:protein-disulfide isomerase